MSIQQDILETIGSSGIDCSALQQAVGNIGANELDLAVNALLRARRVRVVSNRYEVIPSTRILGAMPHSGRPPSAEEEAAASLLPVNRVCVTCGPPAQALCEFRFVGLGDVRAKECNTCHGKRVRAGQGKKRGERSTVSDSRVEQRSARDPHKVEVVGSNPTPASNTVNGSGGAPPADVRPVDPPAPSAASSQRVFERAQVKRQEALNRLALLKVEVANLEMAVAEVDRFLELYQRFAQGAA